MIDWLNAPAGCIADCIRESYSFEPSLLSLNLDGNMKIGSTWIHPNESGHLVALHFFIPSNTQQHIINHYPSLIQTLGKVTPPPASQPRHFQSIQCYIQYLYYSFLLLLFLLYIDIYIYIRKDNNYTNEIIFNLIETTK